MSTKMDELAARIRRLERELETELRIDLEERATRFRYTVLRGRVRFEQEAAEIHARLRKSVFRYVMGTNLRTLLVAPVMYGMLVPLVIGDVAASIFQQTCFRAFGIRRVKRSEYIALDRRHLRYLNWIERMNCDYCGYANGVIAYMREVTARTEQYWCPIKHARRVEGAHAREAAFTEYGDAEAYRRELPVLREELNLASKG